MIFPSIFSFKGEKNYKKTILLLASFFRIFHDFFKVFLRRFHRFRLEKFAKSWGFQASCAKFKGELQDKRHFKGKIRGANKWKKHEFLEKWKKHEFFEKNLLFLAKDFFNKYQWIYEKNTSFSKKIFYLNITDELFEKIVK